MKKRILTPLPLMFISAVLVNFAGLSLLAQDSTNFPTLGKIVRLDPRLDDLLPKDAKLEVITSGFTWCEGPTWNKKGGFLLFSEIPSNTVKKWEEGVGVSDYLHPSGYTGVEDYGSEPGSNGLYYDPEGRLISCEHGDRRVSILSPGGGKRTLVDNYQGKRFNSPNDLTMNSKGDLYFTDPPYGLPQRWEDPRRELEFCGIYLLRANGELVLLNDEMVRPNGIGLSPDEKTLYVAQSHISAPVIMAYPVKKDGTIGKGRVVFDATPFKEEGRKGMPDGLEVDQEGNIWASCPEGIYIITPDGDLLGRLETGEATSNCAWGNDGSMLYITADTYVLRIQTKVTGLGF